MKYLYCSLFVLSLICFQGCGSKGTKTTPPKEKLSQETMPKLQRPKRVSAVGGGGQGEGRQGAGMASELREDD